MDSVPLGLAGMGLLITVIGWVTYLATIPKNTVPVWPAGTLVLEVGGVVLAATGFVWSARGVGSSLLPGVLGAFTAMLGIGFVLLLTQRKTPVGNPEGQRR